LYGAAFTHQSGDVVPGGAAAADEVWWQRSIGMMIARDVAVLANERVQQLVRVGVHSGGDAGQVASSLACAWALRGATLASAQTATKVRTR